MAMEELTITVYIADRPYRLKIKTEEEEFVRRAVDAINEQIREYSAKYAFNDRQDLLAMTALHYATVNLKGEKGDEGIILNRLESLNQLLREITV